MYCPIIEESIMLLVEPIRKLLCVSYSITPGTKHENRSHMSKVVRLEQDHPRISKDLIGSQVEF